MTVPASIEIHPDRPRLCLAPASLASLPGSEIESGVRGCRPSLPNVGSPLAFGQALTAWGKRTIRSGWPGYPQQDLNLRTRLRRPALYPLSYGG